MRGATAPVVILALALNLGACTSASSRDTNTSWQSAHPEDVKITRPTTGLGGVYHHDKFASGPAAQK